MNTKTVRFRRTQYGLKLLTCRTKTLIKWIVQPIDLLHWKSIEPLKCICRLRKSKQTRNRYNHLYRIESRIERARAIHTHWPVEPNRLLRCWFNPSVVKYEYNGIVKWVYWVRCSREHNLRFPFTNLKLYASQPDRHSAQVGLLIISRAKSRV